MNILLKWQLTLILNSRDVSGVLWKIAGETAHDLSRRFTGVIWGGIFGASLVAHMVKIPPAMQETWVQSLGQEDPLEKEMATHSSILAWKNPMDRGAWQATVHGVARAGHSLATKPPTLRLSSEEWPSVSHELQGYLYMKGPRAQTLLHQHQCYMTVQHRVRI